MAFPLRRQSFAAVVDVERNEGSDNCGGNRECQNRTAIEEEGEVEPSSAAAFASDQVSALNPLKPVFEYGIETNFGKFCNLLNFPEVLNENLILSIEHIKFFIE